MSNFDRNITALIEKVVGESVKHSKIGIVDQVYEHGGIDDDSNWEVDLLIDGKTKNPSRIPVHSFGSDAIAAPKNGDKMLLVYTEGESHRPIAMSTAWSSTDRPPLGRAGMYRNQFESGPSPLGEGDLNITGYTSYNDSVASTDKRELTPEETFIQISKHAKGDNVDPTQAGELPAKIEMYDSPSNDQSHIHIDGNQIDGDDTKGLDVKLDFKSGVVTVRGDDGNDSYKLEIDVKNNTAEITGDSNAGNTMGASFDFSTNEFKIADGNKFGIESDGNGNFTWSHQNIDFKEESSGSISL